MHVSCVYFAYDKMQLVYFQNAILWQLWWMNQSRRDQWQPDPYKKGIWIFFMKHNSQKLK